MRKKGEYSRISLYIDGPNMFGHYSFGVLDILEAAETYGPDKEENVVFKKLYIKLPHRLDKTEKYMKLMKLMETAHNNGFKVEKCIYDIDKLIFMDIPHILNQVDTDLVVIAASDNGYCPLADKLVEWGKDAALIFAEDCNALIKRIPPELRLDMRKYMKERKKSNEQNSNSERRS